MGLDYDMGNWWRCILIWHVTSQNTVRPDLVELFLCFPNTFQRVEGNNNKNKRKNRQKIT